MPVMIGVDPHKASHTAAALNEHGQLLDQQRVPATLDGYQQLRLWASRWPQRCWAAEGAHGVGRALAQRLVGDGEQVLDVPAKLAARVRVLSVGHGRKSDADDAVSVAVAAQSAPQLRQVGVEDQAVVLHLLTNGARTWWPPAPRQSTGCTGSWSTWSPAAPDATSLPAAPLRCWPRSRPLVRRR
jgi:transposase